MGQNDDDSKKANELDEATLNRSQKNVNYVKVKQRLGNLFKTQFSCVLNGGIIKTFLNAGKDNNSEIIIESAVFL